MNGLSARPVPEARGKRILVVKLSAIGDIIHAIPAVAALREAFPNARIAWCVEKRCSSLLRHFPVVDTILEMDTRSWRKGKALRGPGGLFAFLKEMRSLRDQIQDKTTTLRLDAMKTLTPEQQDKLRASFSERGSGQGRGMGHGGCGGGAGGAGCFGCPEGVR
jgi:hypothetical protein